jgi:acetolactate synthase-1/2/3 large subunit
MKVSDYIVNFLVENRIDKVFSYIGKNAHICDSIDRHKDIENIFAIHEQGAGFFADAYGRLTGKTGVSTVTSGPGATNLVTAIGDCYFDSVPSMFIVGDVPPSECKGDRDIRQFGFQETDIVTISKPITKYAVSINSLDEIRYEFEKAYYLSQHHRKGPVLISMPENLQFRTDFNPYIEKSFFDSKEYIDMSQKRIRSIDREVKETVEMINRSKRPVILVGGGVRLSNGVSELREFLKRSNIPIVYSLMGKDAISDDYRYNLGFIGNFGTRYANFTISNSDLLIVLGSRLDNLQTGRKIETFARDAKIIQIDIDKNEIGIRLNIDLAIESDIKSFLTKLNKNRFELRIDFWQKKVLDYKKRYPIDFTLSRTKKIGNLIISELSKGLRDDDIICVDVGEHQMLVAQSLKVKDNQRVLFSGGFGSMGFALPSAIGATITEGKRAIVISGDGGFQMNIQELEIIKRRDLPIKMFIINNSSLHMVKLRQDTYLNSNLVGSKKDYSAPNFGKIAEAYGIKGSEVSNFNQIVEEILDRLKDDKASLTDIKLKADVTTVEPRLDFNRSFEDMSPYLARDELKEQMIIRL